MSRRGLPPKFAEIDEKTEPWMPFFLEAFFELTTERPGGMGMMAIPWSKIRQFAEAHGFDGESLSDFHHIIRLMDDHFMAVMNKKHRGKNIGHSPPVRKKDAPVGTPR